MRTADRPRSVSALLAIAFLAWSAVAAPTAAVQTIGGLPGFKYRPVALTERTVTIFPKHHSLAYGRTYYAAIAAGVFRSAVGDSAALTSDIGGNWNPKAAAIFKPAAPPR
jgi:hypothetical protein